MLPKLAVMMQPGSTGQGQMSGTSLLQQHVLLVLILGLAVLLFGTGGAAQFFRARPNRRLRRHIKYMQKNLKNQTVLERRRLAGIEKHTKQVQLTLGALFQETYTNAVSDLVTIHRLRQHASLTSREKQLLDKFAARHMHDIDQQLSDSCDTVLTQFQDRLRKSE